MKVGDLVTRYRYIHAEGYAAVNDVGVVVKTPEQIRAGGLQRNVIEIYIDGAIKRYLMSGWRILSESR